MFFDTSSWSKTKKVHFLVVLAHESTVSARGTYEVGTTGVSEPKLLRAFNEIEHRVTGSLRHHTSETEGMPVEAVLKMLTEFGARYSRSRDMQYAVSRALESTMRNDLERSE